MQLEEVYRSPGMLACQQRAFVLHAVGIASEIVDLPNAFALCVPDDQAANAREQLKQYAAENQPPPRPPPPLHAHAHAWLASIVYGVMLFAANALANYSPVILDWYQRGELTPSVQKSGEWWRVVTALTLHADAAHLSGNIVFGGFFVWLAARLLGPGVAFGSMVLAAAAGNVLDSISMPATHASIGASTMVFAVLGLISAYSWRLQLQHYRSWLYTWAHRWGPLVAGIALLGLIGAGGKNTDVLAHLAGFFCGAILGAGYALMPQHVFARARLQITFASASFAALCGAWLWALFGASG